MTQAELLARVRATPLIERLDKARSMIGKMCAEGRPPKMTIPVHHEDEDFFICTTIKDAIVSLNAFCDDLESRDRAAEGGQVSATPAPPPHTAPSPSRHKSDPSPHDPSR